MYLTVSKPCNRFNMMPRKFERMFDEFFTVSPSSENEFGWEPRADVHETDEHYVVELDVPGIDKKDVKVKFEDNTLTVSGERKMEQKSDEKNSHRYERAYGSFSRTIHLPKNVNTQKINASYKNGVLEITLPKADEVKPKEIEINVN